MASNLPVELYRPIVNELCAEPDKVRVGTLKSLTLTSVLWRIEADRHLFYSYRVPRATIKFILACRQALESSRLQRNVRHVSVIVYSSLNGSFPRTMCNLLGRALRALSNISSLDISITTPLLPTFSYLVKPTFNGLLKRITWNRPIVSGEFISFLRAHPGITTLELLDYDSPANALLHDSDSTGSACPFAESLLDPLFLPRLESFSGKDQLCLMLLAGPRSRPIKRLEFVDPDGGDEEIEKTLWDAFAKRFNDSCKLLDSLYLGVSYLHYAEIPLIRFLTEIPNLELGVLGRCSVMRSEENEFIRLIARMPRLHSLSIRSYQGETRRSSQEQLDFARRLRDSNSSLKHVRYNSLWDLSEWTAKDDGEWEQVDVRIWEVLSLDHERYDWSLYNGDLCRV